VRTTARRCFSELTRHDNNDLITTAGYSTARNRYAAKVRQLVREQLPRASDLPGVGRQRARAHRHSAAARRGSRSTSPARSTARRSWARTRRGRRRGASPTRRSRSAAGVQGVVATPNGNRFFVRVYSGVMKPNMRAYNPGQGREGERREAVPRSTPTRPAGWRKSRAARRATSCALSG